MMQDQKSLKLCWPSFSSWGSQLVIFFFAYKGGQYFDYVQPLPNQFLIT